MSATVGIVLAALCIFGLLIVMAIKQIVVDEIVAAVPWFGHLLIRSAVRQLPQRHQARYEREWIGELGSSRVLEGLRYAVGVRLGVRSTNAELREEDLHLGGQSYADPGPRRQQDPALASVVVGALVLRTAPPPLPWDEMREMLRATLRADDLDAALERATLRFESAIDEARVCGPYVAWVTARPPALDASIPYALDFPQQFAVAHSRREPAAAPVTDLRRRRRMALAAIVTAAAYLALGPLMGNSLYPLLALTLLATCAVILRRTAPVPRPTRSRSDVEPA